MINNSTNYAIYTQYKHDKSHINIEYSLFLYDIYHVIYFFTLLVAPLVAWWLRIQVI